VVVIILEKVPPGLRGELTRWMLEPRTGVFVGRVSAMVREKLWEFICQHSAGGGCMMVHSTNNEQGFAMRLFGPTRRIIEDFDGLTLIRIPEYQEE